MKYTKKFLTKFWFDESGNPHTTFNETNYELDDFSNYFIHYLADHLSTLTIDPKSDNLQLLNEFRELYVQCMLDAKHEYVENSYTPP